ncbi:hypothetical protein Mycch_5151 [Mycolicibacterium chubuense NBB4]|uniref:2OG-Fe dioxygenase family protein n=1 Tax=Mycolicibacterium chubuense (strain NBB4) TaxID=710421 RepID=I4BRD0_MYCCN|nr:2OG-Fe dioxygenase family protein [Mycolicibacterium chubuense]AFM19837.1 hypothetical protein Mycch_5151 [Mycolicibacterium chubuense NBB4]
MEDVVTAVTRTLHSSGACVLSAGDLSAHLGAGPPQWRRFARHWDDLAVDTYAARLGTCRMRRYGQFSYDASGATTTPMAHEHFVQPEDSNPLYIDMPRHFEPLTTAFAQDPVLAGLLSLLGRVAVALADSPRWHVKVTPFRVLAAAGGEGEPTPEGVHRDGVTLVTSLLVGRHNAAGGQSSVYTLDGTRFLTTTLATPGTMLLGDDRRTLHGVSPIRPLDPARPAWRDVLVITYAAPR